MLGQRQVGQAIGYYMRIERRTYTGLFGHLIDASLAENVETLGENRANADGIAANGTNLLTDVLFLL